MQCTMSKDRVYSQVDAAVSPGPPRPWLHACLDIAAMAPHMFRSHRSHRGHVPTGAQTPRKQLAGVVKVIIISIVLSRQTQVERWGGGRDIDTRGGVI